MWGIESVSFSRFRSLGLRTQRGHRLTPGHAAHGGGERTGPGCPDTQFCSFQSLPSCAQTSVRASITSHHLVRQPSLWTWKPGQRGGISLSLFEASLWLHFKLCKFSGSGSWMDAGSWQVLYLVWVNVSSWHDSTCIKRPEKKKNQKPFHGKGIQGFSCSLT